MKMLPLSGAILGLTALLTACGGGGGGSQPPVPGNVSSASTFVGKVTDWTAGRVTAEVLAYGDDGLASLTSGTITSDGTVTLNLPKTVSSSLLYPLRPSSCENVLSTSVDNVYALDVQSFLVRQQDRILGLVTTRTDTSNTVRAGTVFVSRFYVDQDVTVSGSVTCPSLKETYDQLTLKRGWNLLTRTVDAADANGDITAVTFRQGAAPSEQNVFEAAPDGVLAQAPANATVTLGLTTTLPVSLLPFGRFSGPVSVRLEGVPGLQVEGDALVIPRFLPAQAQRERPLTALSVDGRIKLSAKPGSTETPEGMFAGTLVFSAGQEETRVPMSVTVLSPFSMNTGNSFPPALQKNSSASVSINLERRSVPFDLALTSIPVVLEGAPAGMTLTPSPVSVSLSAQQYSSSTPATLRLSSEVAPGMYNVRLVGHFNGVRVAGAPFTLTVLQPAPEVLVTGGGIAAPGGRVDFFAKVNSLNGYEGEVQIQIRTIGSEFSATPSSGRVLVGAGEQKTFPFSMQVAETAHTGTQGFYVDFIHDGKTETVMSGFYVQR